MGFLASALGSGAAAEGAEAAGAAEGVGAADAATGATAATEAAPSTAAGFTGSSTPAVSTNSATVGNTGTGVNAPTGLKQVTKNSDFMKTAKDLKGYLPGRGPGASPYETPQPQKIQSDVNLENSSPQFQSLMEYLNKQKQGGQ